MPKIAIFEEASRTLDIPGGVRMIQEYYRQMRKFGCNILAVVQQYDVIKNSPVRGAMIGNSKIFIKLKVSNFSRKPQMLLRRTEWQTAGSTQLRLVPFDSFMNEALDFLSPNRRRLRPV
jgi:hypothetical protein